MPSLATASLDAAERRALRRFVGLLRERFAEDLDGVWLYGPRVRGEPPQDESDIQLVALLRHSSRSDRVTALELLWQAALAERASESYFSIRIADRASPVRRRAIDEFFAREVEPDGIALVASPGPAPRPGGGDKPNSKKRGCRVQCCVRVGRPARGLTVGRFLEAQRASPASQPQPCS